MINIVPIMRIHAYKYTRANEETDILYTCTKTCIKRRTGDRGCKRGEGVKAGERKRNLQCITLVAAVRRLS